MSRQVYKEASYTEERSSEERHRFRDSNLYNMWSDDRGFSCALSSPLSLSSPVSAPKSSFADITQAKRLRTHMPELKNFSSYKLGRRDSPATHHKTKRAWERSQENANNAEDAASDGVNVFIGRLPFDLAESSLAEALSPYNPTQTCICYNKRKRSKGFGFATFDNHQDALNAVQSLDEQFVFPSQKLTLRVELCSEKQ